MVGVGAGRVHRCDAHDGDETQDETVFHQALAVFFIAVLEHLLELEHFALSVWSPDQLPPGSTGGFDHELTEEFFRAFANAAKLTLHVRVEAGSNAHHMIEAAFKAFARALREAVAIDPSEEGVPSTKGTLTS